MALRRRAALALAAAVALAALTACSATLPLTLTVNNKTLIPQVRGWEAANPLVSARAAKARAVAVANATKTSPNPFGTLLNETLSTVRGKERYMKRTVAAAFGKGNTTTLLNTVILGAAAATDLVCIVDPTTGQLVGLKKPGTSLCTMAGSNVTVPTSKGYISQIKAAYTYDGATVGRLIFEVKTAPNATAQRFACGTAGGKAFDLLPKNYALTSLGVSCATSADLAGSGLPGRKLSQIAPTGLSASKLAVEAGPVSSLEAEVAKLAAMGFSGTGFALGVDLYNSALPKPPPLSSVFKSENTSVLVSAVSTSSDGSRLVALLGQDPYTLATSKDGGASFDAYHSFETDAIADADAWVLSVASSDDGQSLLAASRPWQNATDGIDDFDQIYNNGDAWISSDGGASWSAVLLPDRDFYTDVLDVEMSADGATLVVLAQARDGTFVDVSPDNSTTDYQFQDSGVPEKIVFYLSTDSGATWAKSALTEFNDGLGWQVSAEAPRPLQISTDGSRLFVALDQIISAALDGADPFPTKVQSQLLASDDGGATWTSVYLASAIYDYATGGGSGNSIVVLDDSGVQTSSDGGASFALADVGEGEDLEYWNTVEISRNGEYIAVAGEQSYYFAVSSDAGESWEQLPVDPSYWTIAGVSDEGGITSFDEEFFLWTQNAPSDGGSELEAVPSAARAAAKQQAAAAAAAQVAPAIGESFLFGAICGAIGPCNDLRSSIEGSIRTAFGIPCSKNIGVNLITNKILSFFSFGFLGSCPTASLLVQRQAAIRPQFWTFNFGSKSWGYSPEPPHQIRRSAGEYFVRSTKYPAVWQQRCNAQGADCNLINYCEGKPEAQCACYNDGSCSQSFEAGRGTCQGYCAGVCPAGYTCPPYKPPAAPAPPPPQCRDPRTGRFIACPTPCCISQVRRTSVCCTNCFTIGRGNNACLQ